MTPASKTSTLQETRSETVGKTSTATTWSVQRGKSYIHTQEKYKNMKLNHFNRYFPVYLIKKNLCPHKTPEKNTQVILGEAGGCSCRVYGAGILSFVANQCIVVSGASSLHSVTACVWEVNCDDSVMQFGSIKTLFAYRREALTQNIH